MSVLNGEVRCVCNVLEDFFYRNVCVHVICLFLQTPQLINILPLIYFNILIQFVIVNICLGINQARFMCFQSSLVCHPFLLATLRLRCNSQDYQEHRLHLPIFFRLVCCHLNHSCISKGDCLNAPPEIKCWVTDVMTRFYSQSVDDFPLTYVLRTHTSLF